MPFTIALIGRPNVGKSTLFNKLVGKKMAIVDDTPGVTRDRRETMGHLGPMDFRIVDTAGLEENIADEKLEARMIQQTERATIDADLSLLIVDGKVGVTQSDKHFAQWARQKGKPVVLVVNKCENQEGMVFDRDYYKLGFGEPVAVSAEHNQGLNFLYDEIEPYYDKYQENFGQYEVKADEDDEEKHIQIAIIGRPNAGKSTFINQLLKEERLVVGPEAGITRDAISIDWEFEGRPIRLIDTAGIRRKSNIVSELEKASLMDSFRALRYAHVAVLMIDATSPLDKQDLSIASMVIKEGRGIIFVLNKWDKIKEKTKLLKEVQYQLEKSMPEVKDAPIITTSAINGQNIIKVMKECLAVYDTWNIRIPTAKLNQWLRDAESEHTPPLVNGRPVKLKYITQGKRRPPTFMLFTNNPEKLEGAYERYLVNSIRKHFKMPATPIRLFLRKADNPFENVRHRKKIGSSGVKGRRVRKEMEKTKK